MVKERVKEKGMEIGGVSDCGIISRKVKLSQWRSLSQCHPLKESPVSWEWDHCGSLLLQGVGKSLRSTHMKHGHNINEVVGGSKVVISGVFRQL